MAYPAFCCKSRLHYVPHPCMGAAMHDFPLRPLARLFAARHSPHLRYSKLLQSWLAYDRESEVWRPDGTASLNAARELVYEVARAGQNLNMTGSANAVALLRTAAETEPSMSAAIPEKRDSVRGVGEEGAGP